MSETHKVIALLDERHTAEVASLWANIEIELGRPTVPSGSVPHITLHASKSTYDLPALRITLREFARYAQPFTLHANGLGIFTSLNPILHIPVIRTPELNRFQELLWVAAAGTTAESLPYYHVEHWIPHITLASEGTSKEAITRLIDKYTDKIFFWAIQIKELGILSESKSGTRLLETLTFGERRS
jgi:2'-5' RNA ligase